MNFFFKDSKTITLNMKVHHENLSETGIELVSAALRNQVQRNS